MAYFTRPDYSRQLKQYSGTSAIFSGTTNILQAFYVKSIEIDTDGAVIGSALLYDDANNKFRPGLPGSFSGSVISNGFLLSYVSGLTYSVGAGSYNVNGTIYTHNFEYITINSGQTGGSRFDLVYITAGSPTVFIREGVTTTNPTVPNLLNGELEVGIISVPVNFTGGTGSTTIQTTAETVFVYYNNGAGTGIQRAAGGANSAGAGDFSFATGVNSRAYGYNSNAFGYDTIASGYAQTVVGKYNVDNLTDYFIVGYGADDLNRANAFNVTNAGDTYANKRLFVTNVEIETTGTTGSGQILKFDGTKFKPQFEIITGLTLFTGGTNFISSITSNSLLVKALTGSTGITITETDGLITIGLDFSGTSVITDIVSLTGGTSLISGKTGTTYFLYPIQGAGGTSVTLVDGKLTVYSDTSGSTTGANVGAGGAGVFYTKSVNELQFRRLSSATPTNLSIIESGDLIIFSASSSSATIVTLYEDVTYSQLTDKITGSTLQIGKQYRIVSGRINEGAGTFGYVIVNAIDTNKISKNGTLITLNPDYYDIGDYTDVSATPLGSSGIAYSGQSLVTNETAIYNNNHYKVTANTTFNNTLTNLSLLSRDFTQRYGYITVNDYIEYDFTSDTITKRVDSVGNTVEGKSAIDVFPWGRKNQVLNNRVINNSVAEIMNFRGIISGNTFDNNARLVSSFDDTNFILDNTNIRNNVLISAATFTNTQFRNCDISTDFGLVNRTLANYSFNSKLVTSDVNQLETNLNVPSNTLDLTNYNHFGVFNISAATSTFSINAIQNYNQTYKLTFKPLAGYLFNFVHSSTIRNELEDTHPIDGNYDEIITYQKRSKAGTVFYQENINTFKALSALTTTTITDIISVDTTFGGQSLIEDISSASTTGRTVTFKALLEGTNITIDDTTSPGYLIINSTGSGGTGSTSFTGITDIVSAGTGDYSVISSVTNNNLVYRTLSAGTGMQITESNGTLVFVSTATGGTGSTLSGDYLPISGGTLTGDLTIQQDKSLTIINSGNSAGSLWTAASITFEDNNPTWANATIDIIPVHTNVGSGNNAKVTLIPPNGNSQIPVGYVSTGLDQLMVGNGTTGFDFISKESLPYLSVSGGTVSGETVFLSGISATTILVNEISATSITSDTILTNTLSATSISSTSLYTDYIDFNTGATVTSQIARLNWNDTDGTLELGLKGGVVKSKLNQGLITRVVNKTTPLIDLSGSSYHAVVIGGAAGQRLSVKLAKGDNDANSAGTLGLVAEDIATNQEGFIITVGLLQKINTTGSLQGETWNDGDVLYLSPTTAGQITNIKPQAPNHTVIIGYVEYAHANNGKIYVKVDNGYELDELHNVRLTGVSDYNILRYDGVTYSSWTNSSINEVLSKTLLTRNIPVTSQVAQVDGFYLYDKITITSATASVTVTSITSDVSISAYTPSIKFFANTGVTVTFQNSATLKTEGGLDAVISGSTYDSITFTYNNDIQKYFQTNINNYI